MGSEGRDEELVAPSDVEEVVANAEDSDRQERDDCRQEGRQLMSVSN